MRYDCCRYGQLIADNAVAIIINFFIYLLKNRNEIWMIINDNARC